MTHEKAYTRRVFLRDLGSLSVGLVTLGIAGCSSSDTAGTTTGAGAGTTAAVRGSTAASSSTATSSTTETSTTSGPSASAPGWHRINFSDFVSAYVVVRGGEAAIVDTGNASVATPIETALGELGVRWEDVSNVVATHSHGDHIGGFPAVAELAVNATLGIGKADIEAVAEVDDVVGLVDGDNVFGMTVIATPGHTPGHISLHDPDLGVLFTGDALNGGEVLDGEEGTVGGPNTSFTPDMPTALESIRRFEELEFDAIAFGHGEPIESGAKAAFQEYLDSL